MNTTIISGKTAQQVAWLGNLPLLPNERTVLVLVGLYVLLVSLFMLFFGDYFELFVAWCVNVPLVFFHSVLPACRRAGSISPGVPDHISGRNAALVPRAAAVTASLAPQRWALR